MRRKIELRILLYKELNLENIHNFVALSRYTTLRVGGPAQWLVEPKDLDELNQSINWAKKQNIQCQIIGAGSNLLISDHGINGLIICMKKYQGIRVDKENGILEALGGEPLPSLARRAAREGLSGLEWAIGIPGTVGGAAVMNAGAQGNCTAERLKSVQVMPINGGKTYELKNKELNFSYRKSILQKEKVIVISARFHLEAGQDSQEILKTTNENLNNRLKTQPYHLPSCGSVFRNPEPLKAGKIIESLGLKGMRIGGAEVSTMHANFIINYKNATAEDIFQLMSMVQERVYESHGLRLQPEVKKLGF